MIDVDTSLDQEGDDVLVRIFYGVVEWGFPGCSVREVVVGATIHQKPTDI